MNRLTASDFGVSTAKPHLVMTHSLRAVTIKTLTYFTSLWSITALHNDIILSSSVSRKTTWRPSLPPFIHRAGLTFTDYPNYNSRRGSLSLSLCHLSRPKYFAQTLSTLTGDSTFAPPANRPLAVDSTSPPPAMSTLSGLTSAFTVSKSLYGFSHVKLTAAFAPEDPSGAPLRPLGCYTITPPTMSIRRKSVPDSNPF